MRLKTINQTGDTLVEVVMAVAIISGVLASAYAVANNSYRIGVQSRERIEAASLVQQQAELLRAARDKGISEYPDADGPNILPGPLGLGFRMQPDLSYSACNFCSVGPENRYKMKVRAVPKGDNIPNSAPGPDGREYKISVTWDRIGSDGGAMGTEETEVIFTLVDRRIDKTTIDCDEVEQCS